MLTYQVRPRVFRITGDRKPEFPAEVEVSLYFQPLQPFGMAVGDGLTVVRGSLVKILFNANTGQHFAESDPPLMPLDVVIKEPVRLVSLKGNHLTVNQLCQDYEQFRLLVESLYFVLPLLLAMEFIDTPIVERVDGRIGSVPFSWELSFWQSEVFDLTTQEHQEQRVTTAWKRFNILAFPIRDYSEHSRTFLANTRLCTKNRVIKITSQSLRPIRPQKWLKNRPSRPH